MLKESLVFLSALGCCLTILGIFLTDAQQRSIAIWNVRAWLALDQARHSLKASRLVKVMREDHPLVTICASLGMFVLGAFSSGLFFCCAVVSIAAFLGGVLLAVDNSAVDFRDAELIALLGTIAATSIMGLFIGLKGWLLSITAPLTTIALVPLSFVEFVTRRIAEYEKGPLVAIGALLAAALSLLKNVY